MSNVEEEGHEGSDREEQSEGESDDELDTKQQPNQAVLDDDQIQAKQDEKKDQQQNTQANLKHKEAGQKPKQDTSSKQTQENSSSQVDANGQDMLYQLTLMLERRQQQK